MQLGIIYNQIPYNLNYAIPIKIYTNNVYKNKILEIYRTRLIFKPIPLHTYTHNLGNFKKTKMLSRILLLLLKLKHEYHIGPLLIMTC